VACDNDTTPPSFGRGEEEVGWTTTVGNQKMGVPRRFETRCGSVGLEPRCTGAAPSEDESYGLLHV
jgi:hypothetical protein